MAYYENEIMNENKIAGIDWIKGLINCYKWFILQKPENTSVSRATEFFGNYEWAICSDDFTGDHIYTRQEYQWYLKC